MKENIPDVPQKRMLKLFKILRVLSKKSRTVRSLARGFRVSERTMHRYINLLEHMKLVEVTGGLFHRRVNLKVSKCPCCGDLLIAHDLE